MLRVVLVIVLATAVVPPTAAWVVNRRRILRAERASEVLAARLSADALRGPQANSRVFCGPGRMPDIDAGHAGMWASTPHANLAQLLPDLAVPVDPWGNCYLVELPVAGGAGDRISVLSAGPNGTIETPRGDSILRGDDIRRRRP